MSGASANARARARRGVINTNESTQNIQASNYNKKIQETINPNELLLQHDIKIHVFANKLKELYKLINQESNSEFNTSDTARDNEQLLGNALATLDARLDALENFVQEESSSKILLNNLDKRLSVVEANNNELKLLNENNNHESNLEINEKVLKIENEQKELKALLLKIQTFTMEANLKKMQEKVLENNNSEDTKETSNDTLDSSNNLIENVSINVSENSNKKNQKNQKKSEKININ